MDVRSTVVSSEARRWVESLAGRWRLQILSRRTRRNADGSSDEVPSRIRRFVEGLPWAQVKPAMDALLASAPYSGVIANGVDFGVAYRPTITVWQRDAQSAAVGAVRQDATYTLVQDLVEADSRDVYAVGSSSSCSEEVTADYVWDAPGVENLPEGGQGVTYSVAALRRNDDGTFDYQVVKRVAKTQHVEETVVRDDSQARATQELWDNVYGPVDGTYVDHEGAPLDVPAAGTVEETVGGRTVRTTVRIEGLSENPDCTLKFQVVRETAKDAGTGVSCRKTVFEHEHGTVTPGEASVPDHVDEASDGHYEEVEGRLQPDGSYVVTRKATDELSEDDAGLDIRRTTRATITTTTRRNVADRASEPARPGGREVHEMTPGGRYNLTVTTAEPSATPDSARCSATVFEHVHDDVAMQSDITDESASAGGGRHSEIVQDMDEYGVVKKVVRTTYEQAQPEAGRDVRVTTRAKIVTTTSRNVDDGDPDPTAPGSRRSVEMTPGGKYNVSVTEATPSATPDSARCSATVFEHVHDDVAMQSDITDESAPAGGGRHSEIVQDMDEYGVVKKVVRTTYEQAQPEAVIEKRRYLDAVVTRTTERNLKNTTVSAAVGTDASLGVGESVTCELTPGGAVNRTKVVVDDTLDAGKIAESCRRTHFVHTHSTTVGLSGAEGLSESVEHVFSRGNIKTRSVRRTEHGGWEETSEDQDASSDAEYMVWLSTTRSLRTANVYLKGKYIYRNWNPTRHDAGEKGPHGLPPVPKRVNLRAEGLVWREVVRSNKDESETDSDGHSYTVSKLEEEYVLNDGSYSFEDVHAEISINDFHLYDVVFTCSTLLQSYEHPGGAGRASGPGEQGDKHVRFTTFRYRPGDKGVPQRQQIDVHARYVWSTTDNMRRNIIHGLHRPDLGMVSHYDAGLGCAIVYVSIDEGDWTDMPKKAGSGS